MLSNDQRDLLRQCSFNFYDEFGESDRKCIDELISMGLVAYDGTVVNITEKGKASLESFRRESLYHWIPIAISIAALLLSAISLLRTL